MGFWNSIKNRFKRDDEFFAPVIKPAAVVAKRFVLVTLVAELGDSVALEQAGGSVEGVAMRKRALDSLAALGLGPHDLESAEDRFTRGLHAARVDSNDAIAAMWRLECASVLAWALGHIEKIPETIEHAALRAIVPANADEFRAFCDGATVRALHVLMAARHEWSMKFFLIEPQPPSEQRSRLLERARAFRWLTESEHSELSATPVLAGR